MVSPAPQPLYQPTGGHLALDLVNSVGRSPGRFGRERLASYGQLLTWCEEAGCLAPERAAHLRARAEREPAEATRSLARVLDLREASFRTFAALHAGTTPDPRDLEAVNAALAEAQARARVERTGAGHAWGWRLDPPSLDEPLWPLAREVASLLTSDDASRLHECASERCLWLFLDHSRNQRRRWCDMKSCGNLAKVRAHRKRRREREA